jgi:hypothetical protein
MPVVSIGQARFKHSLQNSQLLAAMAEINSALTEAKTLRQKIAFDLQQDIAGLPAIAEFLGSEKARLACAVEAGRKLPKRNRPSLETLLEIPAKLDAKKTLPEIDRVRLKSKKNGGFRIIHEFGNLHRTAKQMMLRVHEPLFNPKPFQYTFAGLHQPIGLAKVELLAGKPHFATLDIKDHFGSFSTKKLAHLLPVPKEWVDYVVGGRHAVVKMEDVDSRSKPGSRGPAPLPRPI